MSERFSSSRPEQVEDELRTNYSFPDAAYNVSMVISFIFEKTLPPDTRTYFIVRNC